MGQQVQSSTRTASPSPGGGGGDKREQEQERRETVARQQNEEAAPLDPSPSSYSSLSSSTTSSATLAEAREKLEREQLAIAVARQHLAFLEERQRERHRGASPSSSSSSSSSPYGRVRARPSQLSLSTTFSEPTSALTEVKDEEEQGMAQTTSTEEDHAVVGPEPRQRCDPPPSLGSSSLDPSLGGVRPRAAGMAMAIGAERAHDDDGRVPLRRPFPFSSAVPFGFDGDDNDDNDDDVVEFVLSTLQQQRHHGSLEIVDPDEGRRTTVDADAARRWPASDPVVGSRRSDRLACVGTGCHHHVACGAVPQSMGWEDEDAGVRGRVQGPATRYEGEEKGEHEHEHRYHLDDGGGGGAGGYEGEGEGKGEDKDKDKDKNKDNDGDGNGDGDGHEEHHPSVGKMREGGNGAEATHGQAGWYEQLTRGRDRHGDCDGGRRSCSPSILVHSRSRSRSPSPSQSSLHRPDGDHIVGSHRRHDRPLRHLQGRTTEHGLESGALLAHAQAHAHRDKLPSCADRDRNPPNPVLLPHSFSFPFALPIPTPLHPAHRRAAHLHPSHTRSLPPAALGSSPSPSPSPFVDGGGGGGWGGGSEGAAGGGFHHLRKNMNINPSLLPPSSSSSSLSCAPPHLASALPPRLVHRNPPPHHHQPPLAFSQPPPVQRPPPPPSSFTQLTLPHDRHIGGDLDALAASMRGSPLYASSPSSRSSSSSTPSPAVVQQQQQQQHLQYHHHQLTPQAASSPATLGVGAVPPSFPFLPRPSLMHGSLPGPGPDPAALDAHPALNAALQQQQQHQHQHQHQHQQRRATLPRRFSVGSATAHLAARSRSMSNATRLPAPVQPPIPRLPLVSPMPPLPSHLAAPSPAPSASVPAQDIVGAGPTVANGTTPRRGHKTKVVFDLHVQHLCFFQQPPPRDLKDGPSVGQRERVALLWQAAPDRGSLKFRFRLRNEASLCVLMDDGKHELVVPLDGILAFRMLDRFPDQGGSSGSDAGDGEETSNSNSNSDSDGDGGATLKLNDGETWEQFGRRLENGRLQLEIVLKDGCRKEFRKREPNRYVHLGNSAAASHPPAQSPTHHGPISRPSPYRQLSPSAFRGTALPSEDDVVHSTRNAPAPSAVVGSSVVGVHPAAPTASVWPHSGPAAVAFGSSPVGLASFGGDFTGGAADLTNVVMLTVHHTVTKELTTAMASMVVRALKERDGQPTGVVAGTAAAATANGNNGVPRPATLACPTAPSPEDLEHQVVFVKRGLDADDVFLPYHVENGGDEVEKETVPEETTTKASDRPSPSPDHVHDPGSHDRQQQTYSRLVRQPLGPPSDGAEGFQQRRRGPAPRGAKFSSPASVFATLDFDDFIVDWRALPNHAEKSVSAPTLASSLSLSSSSALASAKAQETVKTPARSSTDASSSSDAALSARPAGRASTDSNSSGSSDSSLGTSSLPATPVFPPANHYAVAPAPSSTRDLRARALSISASKSAGKAPAQPLSYWPPSGNGNAVAVAVGRSPFVGPPGRVTPPLCTAATTTTTGPAFAPSVSSAMTDGSDSRRSSLSSPFTPSPLSATPSSWTFSPPLPFGPPALPGGGAGAGAGKPRAMSVSSGALSGGPASWSGRASESVAFRRFTSFSPSDVPPANHYNNAVQGRPWDRLERDLKAASRRLLSLCDDDDGDDRHHADDAVPPSRRQSQVNDGVDPSRLALPFRSSSRAIPARLCGVRSSSINARADTDRDAVPAPLDLEVDDAQFNPFFVHPPTKRHHHHHPFHQRDGAFASDGLGSSAAADRPRRSSSPFLPPDLSGLPASSSSPESTLLGVSAGNNSSNGWEGRSNDQSPPCLPSGLVGQTSPFDTAAGRHHHRHWTKSDPAGIVWNPFPGPVDAAIAEPGPYF